MESNKRDELYLDNILKGYYLVNLSYDRDVMTIAGGALIFFVSFLQFLGAECNEYTYLLLMKISWVLFVVSLSLTMLRHFCGIRAHHETLKRLREGRNDEIVRGKWTMWSEWCFSASLFSVVVGLILAIYFIWENTATS